MSPAPHRPGARGADPEPVQLVPEPDAGDDAGTPGPPADEPALLVRNYDGERAYELTVRVLDERDRPRLARTIEVGPSTVRAVGDDLHAGHYTVVVETAGGSRDSADCRLDPRTSDTALVELGNGIASVTDGTVR